MTDNGNDGRADTTRKQILRAASHQFAQRAYHDVGLDDILTEAELTKGAMYFHFRSKHALAVAIIEDQTAAGTIAVEDLLSRNLSGLETLIDFSFLLAAQDIQTDAVRAGLNLLESVGRSEGLQERLFEGWVQALAVVVEKAIADGDVNKRCSPRDVGRLVVSLHMGLRQTSNLDEPERFLLDLEKSWSLVLTGILQPNRIDYFSQFVRRRTALAITTRLSDVESD
ncbi:TetR/AcrR family transcriptional regulator [Mycobacterium parmense]|uniref:TetR/AcrR family transcriptional regulator n=1 Tax=Mycobacterium parmense TaxID=185642 RepID=UPI000A1537B1|nr:TetR/AcrR family transcriptional regulator [Mycobacterium parmense]MCV7352069.1 TetR/AcrR family transcriptional regulator [Mycobacterium parmense]ORW56080.1 TetR family transcriptional regulator [Mycobacterium parmense]